MFEELQNIKQSSRQQDGMTLQHFFDQEMEEEDINGLDILLVRDI